MNLAVINLTEISSYELVETNGGGWIKKGVWAYLATEIIDNWDDIKKGISDGYKDATK